MTHIAGMRRALPYQSMMSGEELERVRRIELPYAAWEAAVLPLNYTRVPGGMNRADTALYRIVVRGSIAIGANPRQVPQDAGAAPFGATVWLQTAFKFAQS